MAAIRVVDPKLVQGRIGEHFRRPATTRDAGLAEPVTDAAPAASVPQPAKSATPPKATSGPQAPTGKAVDYLNAPVEGL